MQIQEPYASRLKALRQEMSSRNLSGLLICRPENRHFISGYSAIDSQLDESSGFLLLTARRQILLTDFRYQEQAEKETPGFDVQMYSKSLAHTVAKLVGKYKISRLGFEENLVTYKVYRTLAENTGAELVPTDGLVENIRVCKDPEEIKKIRKALSITEEALKKTWDYMEPGRTEKDVARFLDHTMLELGAERTAFETIVASGPNAALPHAVPSKRKIKEKESIIFDCGAQLNGYGADISRTIVIGDPPQWLKEIYQLVREAQLAAIAMMGPGVMTNQADDVARRIIGKAGFGPNFGHSLGHGVGLATHEAPSLSKRNPIPLAPGMVVTVEPGIYLPGRGGVRLEEMVQIMEKGARVLNRDKTFYAWVD